MSDLKISELTENTSPLADDVFPMTKVSLPLTQKIKWSVLQGSIVIYSDTEPSNPTDGLLWVDTSERLPLPVGSDDVNKIVVLTQAEYDALTPDAATLYIISS